MNYHEREFHKIRKITSNNSTGDCFGITIPKVIAFDFEGVYFRTRVSGNCIILESGCP